MTDTSSLIRNERNADLWLSLRQLSQLPAWMIKAKDADLVRAVLSQIIPEFVTGQLILKKAKIAHLLLTGGVWTNICDLKVSLPDGTGKRLIELRGRLYPPGSLAAASPSVEGSLECEGWRAVIPELNLELENMETETDLAGLDLLTGPETARAFIEQTIRDNNPACRDLQILSCQPKVVRYKMGDRCTIIYDLTCSPGHAIDPTGCSRVVAKINRTDKGRTAYESLTALWNSDFRSRSTVHLAEPLAYHAGLRVYLQGPVREEQTLSDRMEAAFLNWTPEKSAALDEDLRQVAVGLAQLHQTQIQYGQPLDWADLLSDAQAQIHELTIVFPHFAQAAAPFTGWLSQLDASIPPDPRVPSHGTFRPAQVLLAGNEIGFIDFDSFCQSEPANDLASFLTILMRIGFCPDSFEPENDPAAASEAKQFRFALLMQMREQFLNAYEQLQPVSRQRLALWELAYLYQYVVSAWTKNKGDELPFQMELLERYLAQAPIG